ncbi:alpha/beta fold hydrolase [Sphingosinicella soli]|uniref:Pimeloyl-ACP methyl ester carboxylesterase n=1 Tax=Sphingosinicella soli TaxID=333708 RepID=A0A7W7F6N9_9SPHN|nr:alpha/beta hydrolase [Sphingosinicella soli]MBB4632735.1 pimeloyl-ACP methyl ester carboxylesterase [Sphingosinicella soli]
MSDPLPVVLACGQLLTREVWAPQIAAWSAEREVIVADHTQDETIAGMAQRLLDAAPPRFALAAHAMGGFTAFEVMRQAPERVARLALLATLAPADGPAQTARRQGYIDLVEAGHFQQVAQERIPMLLSPARSEDPALVDAVRRMAAETGAETFLRQQRAIMSRADSRPSLEQIRVPTLILWGDADGITTRAHQDELAAGIPNARFDVLPGIGHLLTLEAPKAVSDTIALWLAEA